MLDSRIVIGHNDITEKRMARPHGTSATPNFPDPSAWPAFLLSQVGRLRRPFRGPTGATGAQAAARRHPPGARPGRRP